MAGCKDVLCPEILKIVHPGAVVFLFVDQHASYLSIEVEEFWKAQGIGYVFYHYHIGFISRSLSISYHKPSREKQEKILSYGRLGYVTHIILWQLKIFHLLCNVHLTKAIRQRIFVLCFLKVAFILSIQQVLRPCLRDLRQYEERRVVWINPVQIPHKTYDAEAEGGTQLQKLEAIIWP